MYLKSFGIMHDFMFLPLEGRTANREKGNFSQGTIGKHKLLARQKAKAALVLPLLAGCAEVLGSTGLSIARQAQMLQMSSLRWRHSNLIPGV